MSLFSKVKYRISKIINVIHIESNWSEAEKIEHTTMVSVHFCCFLKYWNSYFCSFMIHLSEHSVPFSLKLLLIHEALSTINKNDSSIVPFLDVFFWSVDWCVTFYMDVFVDITNQPLKIFSTVVFLFVVILFFRIFFSKILDILVLFFELLFKYPSYLF